MKHETIPNSEERKQNIRQKNRIVVLMIFAFVLLLFLVSFIKISSL